MSNVEKNPSKNERVVFLTKKAQEIRISILKMIHKAQSGHPGGSLSATDIVTALYFDQLNVNPKDPTWANRDRFVLSKGHACPVWYASLAHKGFIPMDALDTLRTLGSPLQGHPVKTKCPGIDATAGSLGVGFAQALGMALESKAAKRDNFVYAVLGDGELQEGIVWETAQAAGKYKLDHFIAIVDNNGLQNDGFTKDVMPVEPIEDKFRAFGWDTTRINGHDMNEIVTALDEARTHTGKPFCIVANTVKGKGVSFMENVRAWHGKPPSDEQLATAIAEITKDGLK